MILFEKLLANVAKKPKFVHFDDPEVERIFLANFDKDGDGKISIEEAKEITSINGLFSNNTKIKSLNALRYTSLPKYSKSMILGENKIERITFPTPMSHIQGYTFTKGNDYLFTNLKEVVLLSFENVPEGFDNEIKECVDYPQNVKFFGWAQPQLKAKVTIIRAKTPPQIGNFALKKNGKLYVPDESVQAYKSDANFSRVADRIFPLSECEYK